jgi:hypothetical protein
MLGESGACDKQNEGRDANIPPTIFRHQPGTPDISAIAGRAATVGRWIRSNKVFEAIRQRRHVRIEESTAPVETNGDFCQWAAWR